MSWSFPVENTSTLAKNDIKPENATASPRNKRYGKSKGHVAAQLVDALRYKPGRSSIPNYVIFY